MAVSAAREKARFWLGKDFRKGAGGWVFESEEYKASGLRRAGSTNASRFALFMLFHKQAIIHGLAAN